MNPNEEGRRRYPESNGYYTASHVDPVPCTCVVTCDPKCAGECGCSACMIRFQEFISDVPQFFKADLALDEDRALRAYRFGDWS